MLIDRSLVEAALPGYAVEGDLGKGGYGLVLAGQHRLIGRKVAIKILLDTSDDPDLRARFLSEARVLAELDHPHIVRIHDYVEHQGTCLLVMELLSGGTLKQRMATGKLSPETICAIGIAASAALATAHSHGVLHRDVKPDNMMFDGAGLLKVTDFGIAKIFDGAETTASAILGTPRYMAPEQIMGGRLFPSTDLYALAGVLYEMLADRPLFGRQMAVQPLTHHHLSVMPEPLTMVPAPISAVIMRTLAKEPGARFSDASELAQELAAAGTRSFGPGWFARSEVKVRVDDDIRAALGGTGTGMQSGAAPTVRASGGFPTGGPGGMGGPSYPPGSGQQGPGQPAGGGYRGQPQGGPQGQPHPGYPGTGAQLPGMSRPGQPGYNQAGYNQPGYSQPGYSQPGYGQPGGSTPHPRPLQGPPSTTPAPGPLTPPGSTPHPRPVGPPPGSTPQPAPLGRPGPTRPFPGQPGQGGSNFGGQGWGGANAAPTQRPPAQNVPPGSQRPPGHRNQDSNDNSRTLIIAAVVFVLVVALTVGLVVALSGGGGKDDGGDEVRSSPANAVAYSGAAVTVQGLSPYSLSIDDQGALLITSLATDRLQKISATGSVSDLAGTGSGGFSGDGGPATAAKLDGPGSAVTDGKGNIYIPDARNYRIRKIASDGTISTIAGTGVAGYSGDGGPATAAQLKSAEKLAVAPDGSIYIADYENHRIRKIGTDGIITTIAGTGVDGYSGEGGPATAATLNGPNDVEVASDGTLYIANLGSDTIQKINTDGTIHTVAGTGEQGYSGDGGPATKAQLSIPSVSVGSNGTLYIADYGNNRIRKVDANGTITTIAGTGSEGSSGDGGPATEAKFTDPSSVVEDSTGALYIADSGNNRIRRIAPDGTITTIAE